MIPPYFRTEYVGFWLCYRLPIIVCQWNAHFRATRGIAIVSWGSLYGTVGHEIGLAVSRSFVNSVWNMMPFEVPTFLEENQF